MNRALIVAANRKAIDFFSQVLNDAQIVDIVESHGVAHANQQIEKSKLLVSEFDLVIINSPLADGDAVKLSCEIADMKTAQVILTVDAEILPKIADMVENAGVFTLSKPINRAVFLSTIKLARAVQNRIDKMQTENLKLKQQIRDIKIIDRAKYILMSYMAMSEDEAHKYIERQAMDLRITRREVAESILRTYEY